MDMWEYKMLLAEVGELEALLPKLGEQGWELTAMIPVPVRHEKAGALAVTEWETIDYRVVFKRRQR